MPWVGDSLNKLGEASFLSKIDLCVGFFQIPVKDSDIEKTAFVCPLGIRVFKDAIRVGLPLHLSNVDGTGASRVT